MQLLDGKALSEKILSNLKLEIRNLPFVISLHVILVGDDPASVKYVGLKQKKCLEVGIKSVLHHLPAAVPPANVQTLVVTLNQDPAVSGFFIQLPLPETFNTAAILSSINPAKDVDGLNPNSGFFPAVVVGITKLLEAYDISIADKNIVIVNDTNLIGQPLKKVFRSKGGAVVLCNNQTSDLSGFTKTADILVSATGCKNLITAGMVKDGAVVVDVGGGDVDFENVKDKCSFITPTFGGVGPMTVASLLSNLLKNYAE